MAQEQNLDQNKRSVGWIKIGMLIGEQFGSLREDDYPITIYIPDWLYADIETEDFDSTRYAPSVLFRELCEHPSLSDIRMGPDAQNYGYLCIGEDQTPIAWKKLTGE